MLKRIRRSASPKRPDLYNHNLEPAGILWRNRLDPHYQDRLDTLAIVRAEGINLCCGIIGMGEKEFDRASLLRVLSEMNRIRKRAVNALVPCAARRCETRAVDAFDMVRMIAVARVVMPRSRIRCRRPLRNERGSPGHVLHAAPIRFFYGEKLLTIQTMTRQRIAP